MQCAKHNVGHISISCIFIQMCTYMASNIRNFNSFHDYQVTEEDQAIWRKNFETHKNWKFTTYPNATHLMIDGEGTPTNEEYKTKGHVNQAFIEDMASFIKK